MKGNALHYLQKRHTASIRKNNQPLTFLLVRCLRSSHLRPPSSPLKSRGQGQGIVDPDVHCIAAVIALCSSP